MDGEGHDADRRGHADQRAEPVNTKHGLPPKVRSDSRPTGRTGWIPASREYTDLGNDIVDTPFLGFGSAPTATPSPGTVLTLWRFVALSA